MLEKQNERLENEYSNEYRDLSDLDPKGVCICPICGFKIHKEVGIPCYNKSCPRCGMLMTSSI